MTLFHSKRRQPTLIGPRPLNQWCPDHGYFWSSCPGCAWREHGEKFGMTLAAVKTQEIARALEDEHDRLKRCLENVGTKFGIPDTDLYADE